MEHATLDCSNEGALLIAKSLKSALLERLDLEFGSKDFTRVSDKVHGDSYVRTVDGTRFSIDFSFSPRSGLLIVEIPAVSIRFDAVEELVARHEDRHPLETPQDLWSRRTLCVSMETGFFGWLTRKQWTVLSPHDASKAAEEIVVYVSGKADPIFAELSKPRVALNVLLADDDRSKSYGGPDGMRAKRAICISLIFEGRDSAMHVARTKLATLKGHDYASVRLWFDRFRQEIDEPSAAP